MRNGTKRTNRVITASLGVLVLGFAASCSSGDPTPTATLTEAPSPSESTISTVVFDKSIQQKLADVGCYTGSIDGIMGPGTDAAIVEFQKAKGLETDGELGPETDEALATAADAGEIVCGGSASPTSTPTKAPCTATAIQAALPPGDKVTSFVCAEGGVERWAAGDDANKEFDAVFIMKDNGGKWETVPRDEICGTASAGIPESILKYCDVS